MNTDSEHYKMSIELNRISNNRSVAQAQSGFNARAIALAAQTTMLFALNNKLNIESFIEFYLEFYLEL